MARDAGARSIVALGAGILVAVPVLSAVYMVQPDNFSLYQPLVVGALWLGRARPPGFAALVRRPRACWPDSRRCPATTDCSSSARSGWPSCGTAGAPTGTTPRLVRPSRWRPRWRASACSSSSWPRGGCASSTSSDRSRHRPPRARSSSSATSGNGTASRRRRRSTTCSAWASGPFSLTRIGGLVAALMIYMTLVAGFVLAPFMVIGGWARRRSIDFGPFFVYAALLFAFSALVSAVHVPGGTFIHSAVALAPHSYILALEGIAIAVGWIAARRHDVGPGIGDCASSAARPSRSRSGPPSLGACSSISAWADGRTKFQQVARGPSTRRALAPATASCRSTRRARSTGPVGAGWSWSTTRSGPSRSSPAPTTSDWLVLDRADSVAAVAPILDGAARPAWLGEPILTEGSPTRLAVYPVVAGTMSRVAKPPCRRSRLRRRARSSGPSSPPRSSSRSPRTRPTTSAWRATSSEGRGLVSDALWSYGTPPLVFPRPAFEVWLPLPSLLAALPMLLLGHDLRGGPAHERAHRRASSRSSPGGSPPTSRTSAACRSGPARRWRARHRADQRGRTCRWSSIPPCPTRPCCSPPSPSGRLLAHDPHRARPARSRGRCSTRGSSALGVLIGLAALTRNEAVWIGARLGGHRLARAARRSWRSGPAHRRGRRGRAFIVFAPWAVRNLAEFGSPLPGQAITNACSCTGFDIFAWNDPPTLDRYLALGLGRTRRAAPGRPRPQPRQCPVLLGLPISLIGLAGAARGRSATARSGPWSCSA